MALSPEMKNSPSVPFSSGRNFHPAILWFPFQRYASVFLLSTAPLKFIKVPKKSFLLCAKKRPGFLLRKPGRFVCFMGFYSRFSSAHTITCGDFWSQPEQVAKLQSVQNNDKSLFSISQLIPSSFLSLFRQSLSQATRLITFKNFIGTYIYCFRTLIFYFESCCLISIMLPSLLFTIRYSGSSLNTIFFFSI